LKVIDLFCGAGGFSEGFRLAGFEIVFALDNWGPAIDTFKLNNPSTEVVKGDITQLDPNDLPKADIIIGGPPCTSFSFANKGGKGNREEGMRLVLAFLRIVHHVQPKWWVMENVPRLLETLPSRIPLEMLGLEGPGYFEIPRREILLSADYGAPQKRRRLVSGKYPLPKPTHSESGDPKEWLTVRDVFNALPDPTKPRCATEQVVDPNYEGCSVTADLLTDHFYDTILTDEEARENRKAKTDHSWYGKMSFPDELDRPARTVMATQFRVSRETMVFETKVDGELKYRCPTVRECACLQSFPLTYQFTGNSETTKLKLVGNAVASRVATAIASEIVRSGKRKPTLHVVTDLRELQLNCLSESYTARERQAQRKLKLNRRFRDHVPGSRVPGFRVDLDNMGDRPARHPLYKKADRVYHLTEWVARLYTGSGKTTLSRIIGLEEALEGMAEAVEQEVEARARLFALIDHMTDGLPTEVPDATTLQGIRSEHVDGIAWTPYVLLETASNLTEQFYPERDYGGYRFSSEVYGAIAGDRDVPLRTAATLLVAAYVSELANRGVEWINTDRTKVFIPTDWPEPTVLFATNLEPKRLLTRDEITAVLEGYLKRADTVDMARYRNRTSA